MEKVVVVLPAYNEELTIAETIHDYHRELSDAFFVIVSNASSDNTFSKAQYTLDSLSARGIVIEEPSPGKGNAVRRGLNAIDAEVYVLTDADMTYPAKHVHAMIQAVEDNHADMVVGDRRSKGHYKHENKRSFHNFGNILVCKLVNKLFGSKLIDIMSGYRVLSRDFVSHYPILVEGFQLETDMTLHALDKRFRVIEMPVEYKDRPLGSESKLSTFRDGARVIMAITRIFRHYKPLIFFGSVSVILTVLSLISAIPVFQDWIEHQYIYHVPLAILASALALLAALAMALGLILDSIVYFHKMDFERNYRIYTSGNNE